VNYPFKAILDCCSGVLGGLSQESQPQSF